MARQAYTELSADFKLGDCSTEAESGLDKDQAAASLAKLRETLTELQDRLYASRQGSILLVLQGMDTAGKDGTIRRLFESISPQGLLCHAFKQPNAEEQAHDFLWRAHLRTPERGYISIFNRSYYEAVVSDHVEGMIDQAERNRRCQHVRNFEAMLADNGTRLLKCFLHISKDEQKARLLKRLEDPMKRWKFSEADLASRARWDDYQAGWSAAIARTASKNAPWHVIPADRKWYRDLVVAELLVEILKDMDPQYPALQRQVRPEEIK